MDSGGRSSMHAKLCSPCSKALTRFKCKWTLRGPPHRQNKNRHSARWRQDISQSWRKSHTSFETFQTAVLEGCFLCSYLWVGIRSEVKLQFEQANSSHTFVMKIRLGEFDGRKYTELECIAIAEPIVSINKYHEDVISSWTTVPIFETSKDVPRLISKPSDDHADGSFVSKGSSDHLDDTSEAASSTLQGLREHGKRWIEQCLKGHRCCMPESSSGSWYPCRLIYIETKTSNPSYRLRLVDRMSLPKAGRYTTLSHRWSDKEFFKLTQLSIDTMKQGFDSSILADTFKDAVTATHYLGYAYIWIDSLCIIQDSIQDWLSQSAEMHEIYSNSICTLSAAWAEDCSARMFSRSKDTAKVSNEVQLRQWFKKTEFRLFDTEMWENLVDISSLAGRGWIVQERILSPRTLHFAEHQVLWECRETRASENWPTGIPDDRRPSTGKSTKFFKKLLFTDLKTDRQWEDIVAVYSATKLTYPSDRLVALSGVANTFALAHGHKPEDYIAGMWRSTLTLSMFWYREIYMVKDPRSHLYQGIYGQASTESDEFVAPSFSWASLACMVTFPSQITPCFKLQACHVKPTADDAFGKVQEGYITLRGAVWTADVSHLEPRDNTPNIVFNHQVKFFGTLRMNWRSNTMQESLYCIHGLENRKTNNWWTVHIILLKHVPENGTGTYRRVGYASMYDMIGSKHKQDVLSSCKDLSAMPLIHIPSLEHYSEDNTHLIKII